MLTGNALIKNVRTSARREGECAAWWLGQSGLIIKLGQTVIGLDLFLSRHDRRRIPPLLKPNQCTGFNLILGTHDHRDHIDRPAWPAIAQTSPQALFVVPAHLLPRLANELGLPPDRFIGLDDGTFVEINGIRITGIAAAHEFLDRDRATGRYPYLGFMVEARGFRFYHSGDCCVYEGLQSRLARWPLDLALLPINGRDARRLAAKCIGNMTYQEAADLAGALGPGLTIPMHYDMFAHNSEDPQLFLDYMRVKYPRLKAAVARHGVRMIVHSARYPAKDSPIPKVP